MDRSDYFRVSKPARYVGGEYGAVKPKGNAAMKMCLCFPDVYEVGMSNLGTRILYYMLNEDPSASCERCYAPWDDMGSLLKERRLPLTSIETHTPLSDFDIIGFSFQYELSYSNMLYMLDLAGIPFRAEDRDEKHPIVIFGGPCMVNPAPVLPFADLINIGEGEITLPMLSGLFAEAKKKGMSKREIIGRADSFEGFYAPQLHRDADGYTYLREKKVVRKQKVKDLDTSFFPDRAIVSNLEVIHDRAVAELFRGCANGCRFCQAGFIYRPVRERSPERVKELCVGLIKNTGYDELSLNSLSTSDYSGLKELVSSLRKETNLENVRLSLPSLRLNSFEGVLKEEARKTSLTFAPEAGTQRLRDVINKNITEKDIFSSLEEAFREGYSAVKLYFMLGLPTETDEDVKGIAELALRVRELYFKTRKEKKDLRLNVSASIFIPKPFTPFQWESFIGKEEAERRIALIRTLLRGKNVNFAWHDWESSVMEAVFARGDHTLAALLEDAYSFGAKMDGWAEFFNYEAYMRALDKNGFSLSSLTGGIPEDSPLPWEFVDVGVNRDFLLRERKRAYAGKTTPACYKACSVCGIGCEVKNDHSEV